MDARDAYNRHMEQRGAEMVNSVTDREAARRAALQNGRETQNDFVLPIGDDEARVPFNPEAELSAALRDARSMDLPAQTLPPTEFGKIFNEVFGVFAAKHPDALLDIADGIVLVEDSRIEEFAALADAGQGELFAVIAPPAGIEEVAPVPPTIFYDEAESVMTALGLADEGINQETLNPDQWVVYEPVDDQWMTLRDYIALLSEDTSGERRLILFRNGNSVLALQVPEGTTAQRVISQAKVGMGVLDPVTIVFPMSTTVPDAPPSPENWSGNDYGGNPVFDGPPEADPPPATPLLVGGPGGGNRDNEPPDDDDDEDELGDDFDPDEEVW